MSKDTKRTEMLEKQFQLLSERSEDAVKTGRYEELSGMTHAMIALDAYLSSDLSMEEVMLRGEEGDEKKLPRTVSTRVNLS